VPGSRRTSPGFPDRSSSGLRPDSASWPSHSRRAGRCSPPRSAGPRRSCFCRSLLIFFAGLFDVVDGEVARTTGRTSVRGDFLDHVLDRYADLFLVLGIAVSGFANPLLALLALVSLLLTSYMGTQAQAVGQGRLYGGLLSRADRLVVLAVAAFLEFDWSLPWPWAPSEPWARFHVAGIEFTVLDVAFLYFVIAGQWTAFARAWRVYRSLPPSP